MGVAIAVVIAGVALVALFIALLAPRSSVALVGPTALSSAIAPGEVRVIVSSNDTRRREEISAVLEAQVATSLARGVTILHRENTAQFYSNAHGSVITSELLFKLSAEDPAAVIGSWFDFEGFVETASFACAQLLTDVPESQPVACEVVHLPSHGGAVLASKLVDVDGVLRFGPVAAH